MTSEQAIRHAHTALDSAIGSSGAERELWLAAVAQWCRDVDYLRSIEDPSAALEA